MNSNLSFVSRFLCCRSCAALRSYRSRFHFDFDFVNGSPKPLGLAKAMCSQASSESPYSPGGGTEGGEGGHNKPKVPKFAYGAEPMSKKAKDASGLLNLKTVQLPEQLQKNLQEFLKKYPKKILQNDGIKLSRHLKNRGRPTEYTWKKYREAKRALKIKGNHFVAEDVLEWDRKQFTVSEPAGNDQEQGEEIHSGDESEEQEPKAESEREDGVSAEHVNLKEGSEQSKGTETKKVVKKPRREEYKVIRYGKRETAAYSASRLPASYGATLRALHEIARREPDYRPETLLDFGSGTGTTIWAAHEKWGEYIQEYQCVDISEEMNSAAEFLLRGSDGIQNPLHIPRVYFKRFLPISNKVTYDLVVASYSLSELPKSSLRKAAVASLWGKTNDFLVIVEHGNTEGFEVTLEARKLVLREELENPADDESHINVTEDNDGMDFFSPDEGEMATGYVFAPCPHDKPCPRDDIETRDHPCNFVQRVPLAFSQRNTGLKKWSCYSERFAYIVLRKGQRDRNEQTWPRILESVKKRKRHVICKLCSSGGSVEQKILTKKKDSDVYKCARHLSQWGDLLPLPGDRVRPVKLRKEEALEN